MPSKKPTPDDSEPRIGVGLFVNDPSHAVPVSGLLADQPQLADAELTRAEWEQKLATYLRSPRP